MRANHIIDKSLIICIELPKTIGNQTQHFVNLGVAEGKDESAQSLFPSGEVGGEV
jgi:hypothetical protein